MKTRDLADYIAEETGIQREEVLRILDCVQCLRSACRHYNRKESDERIRVFHAIVQRYKFNRADTYDVCQWALITARREYDYDVRICSWWGLPAAYSY